MKHSLGLHSTLTNNDVPNFRKYQLKTIWKITLFIFCGYLRYGSMGKDVFP